MSQPINKMETKHGDAGKLRRSERPGPREQVRTGQNCSGQSDCGKRRSPGPPPVKSSRKFHQPLLGRRQSEERHGLKKALEDRPLIAGSRGVFHQEGIVKIVDMPAAYQGLIPIGEDQVVGWHLAEVVQLGHIGNQRSRTQASTQVWARCSDTRVRVTPATRRAGMPRLPQ